MVRRIDWDCIYNSNDYRSTTVVLARKLAKKEHTSLKTACFGCLKMFHDTSSRFALILVFCNIFHPRVLNSSICFFYHHLFLKLNPFITFNQTFGSFFRFFRNKPSSSRRTFSACSEPMFVAAANDNRSFGIISKIA